MVQNPHWVLCYLERMAVLEYVLFDGIYSVSVVLGLRIKWELFQLLCRGSNEVRQLVVEIFVLIFDVFLVFCLSEDTSMKQWLLDCGLLLVILQLVGSLGVGWLVVAVFLVALLLFALMRLLGQHCRLRCKLVGAVITLVTMFS